MGRRLAGMVLCLFLWSTMAWAECRLVWDAPANPVVGYRVYVSPELQAVKDRAVAPLETLEPDVLCTTASVDLLDYAAVSAYDTSGNESPLSNTIQRKNLVAPSNMKVRHFIEVTE